MAPSNSQAGRARRRGARRAGRGGHTGAGLLAALALLSGCGGTAARGAPSPARAMRCDEARLEAQRAWREVAREAAARTPRPAGPPLRLERVLARLEAHAAALRARPHEVSGEEAFALADDAMEGLDEVSDALPRALRDRAEDATEALLTDRGPEGAARASAHAVAVFTEVVQRVRPEAASARRAREGLTEVEAGAARAAEGYAVAAAVGDRQARRAAARSAALEAAALEAAALGAPLAAADEASRDARAACGLADEPQRAETLAVPVP